MFTWALQTAAFSVSSLACSFRSGYFRLHQKTKATWIFLSFCLPNTDVVTVQHMLGHYGINWFTIEMPPQFNFVPLSFCNWINKTVVPVISQDILFCITNITEVMEIRLQYILHFLGSNVSKTIHWYNSTATHVKAEFFFFFSSHTDTHLARWQTHKGGKHILKAIYITTAFSLNCDVSVNVL